MKFLTIYIAHGLDYFYDPLQSLVQFTFTKVINCKAFRQVIAVKLIQENFKKMHKSHLSSVKFNFYDLTPCDSFPEPAALRKQKNVFAFLTEWFVAAAEAVDGAICLCRCWS